MQKMLALGQRLKELEANRDKLLWDGARMKQTIARLEGERDKSKFAHDKMKIIFCS